MVHGCISTLYDVKTQFFSSHVDSPFLIINVDNPSHHHFSNSNMASLPRGSLWFPHTALHV